MSPHDHKVVLDEQAWQWVGFLLETGKITIAEVVDIAREQVAS